MHLAQLEPGLTLTAEASTSHKPQPRPRPFALPVHALDPFGIVIVVRNVDPRQLVGDKFSQPRGAPESLSAKRLLEEGVRATDSRELRLTEMPPTSIKQQAAMQSKSFAAKQMISGNELTELDSVIQYTGRILSIRTQNKCSQKQKPSLQR